MFNQKLYILSVTLLLLLLVVGNAQATSFCYSRETAVSEAGVGRYLQVAMDAPDRIHVVHWDSLLGAIRYTLRTDGLWQTTDLVPAPDVDGISISLQDPAGPLVAYIDGATGNVVCFDAADPAGSTRIVNPGGPAATAIVLESDDLQRYRLMYYGSDGGIWYAELIGSEWSAPFRVTDAVALGGMAFDPSQRPWIVFNRAGQLLVLVLSDGAWLEYDVVTDAVGLGNRPAIVRNSSGGMSVAWFQLAGHGVWVSTGWTSNWSNEYVGSAWSFDDPELGIYVEPRYDELRVTAYDNHNPVQGMKIWDNNSGSDWGSKWLFYSTPGTGDGTVAAPSVSAGLVVAHRGTQPGLDHIQVQHTEVVPFLSASFLPNPSVAGDTTMLYVFPGCADRVYYDGVLLGSGQLHVVPNVAGLHTLDAENSFATTSLDMTMDIVTFGSRIFEVSRPLVAMGDEVLLSWDVGGADVLTIEPGGYESFVDTGSLLVIPTKDTTWTLVAENTGYGTTTLQAAVDVELFTSFTFVTPPKQLIPGESALLSWSVGGADSVWIEPGGFISTEPTGSISVAPTDSTLYTLTAVNSGYGQQSAQVLVPVVPARIATLTATPDLIVVGEAVALAWQVEGTAEVTVAGFGSQSLVGEIFDYPSESRQYVLTADSGDYQTVATVDVTVIPYLKLEMSFSRTEIDRTPLVITEGVPFDVYVHWSGPARRFNGLEFGLDLPLGAVIPLSSQLLVSNVTNFGSNTDWILYGDCAVTPRLGAISRITLLPYNAAGLAGASVGLQGISGGTFPSDPGWIDCDMVVADLHAGAALPLESGVSAATLPQAGTAINGLHPNPFNPRVTVRFTLRGQGEARLAVYDLAGRRVRQLELGSGGAGQREVRWDGRDNSGREAPSGVYLFKLEEGKLSAVARGLLVR